eukprot:scaffold4274_cov175-Amphora_coffeaeformis.AAC.9
MFWGFGTGTNGRSRPGQTRGKGMTASRFGGGRNAHGGRFNGTPRLGQIGIASAAVAILSEQRGMKVPMIVILIITVVDDDDGCRENISMIQRRHQNETFAVYKEKVRCYQRESVQQSKRDDCCCCDGRSGRETTTTMMGITLYYIVDDGKA